MTRGTRPSGSSDIAMLVSKTFTLICMLTSHRSMPQGPCSPQIFFGRDSELEEIVHMVFTNLGPRPARIAILGPPGYGKTTLANAVLTDECIQEHFGKARYFVACESVFSAGALLAELAKTLGLLDGATTDASWSRIRSVLDKEDSSFVLITSSPHGTRMGILDVPLKSCCPGLLSFRAPPY